MEEYFDGKVEEVLRSEDAAYLLDNNDLFYDIGFKVMESQENSNLIKCHRLKYNGKTKLMYFTRDLISLEDYLAGANAETTLAVVKNLIEVLIQIENLGFLNMECIDNRLSHMFLDPNTNMVQVIYLPVTLSGVHKNKNEFENETKAQLLQLLGRLPIGENPKVRQVMDALGNGSLKLHDVVSKLGGEQAGYGVSVQAKFAGMGNSNMGTTTIGNSAAGFHQGQGAFNLLSVDGQFRFVIDRPEFLIGKSNDRVNGVILGNNAVSRVHCKVLNQNGNFYMVDMGSSNGTFVNGERLASNAMTPIREGSRIRIANIDFIARRM